MRRLPEAIADLARPGGGPVAMVAIAETRDRNAAPNPPAGYDLLVEVDTAVADAAMARSSAPESGDTDWRPLSDEWLAATLGRLPAGAGALLHFRSWPLALKLAQRHGLTFASADHVAVQIALVAGGLARQEALHKASGALERIGFVVHEAALPAGRPKQDLIHLVASRRDLTRADGRDWMDALGLADGGDAEPADGPQPADAASGLIAIRDAAVEFRNGYAEGRFRLESPPAGGLCVAALVGGAPTAVAEARAVPGGDGRDFAFRLWTAPEVVAATDRSLSIAAFATPRFSAMLRVARPSARRFVPEELIAAEADALARESAREAFGVLLVGGGKKDPFVATLESLAAQDCAAVAHVWFDGAQGQPEAAARVAASAATARTAGFPNVRALSGRIGRQKLMIHALAFMARRYDSFLVLDEAAIPDRDAIAIFRGALEEGRGDPRLFSVYGDHSGAEGRAHRRGRFRSRGWAAYADRIAPLLPRLAYLYSLEEEDYVAWVSERLTEEVRARIGESGRRAGEAVPPFFSWSEALGLLAALDGFEHTPTPKRVVRDPAFAAGPAAEGVRMAGR